MTSEELLKLVEEIEEQKCETQTRELKSAQFGCRCIIPGGAGHFLTRYVRMRKIRKRADTAEAGRGKARAEASSESMDRRRISL